MAIFVNDDASYKRELDVLTEYKKQTSYYLHKSKSIPLEEAEQIISNIIKDKLVDPKLIHFHREENGDRAMKETTLLRYIYDNIQNDNILVPTFTTYLNANTKKSILAEFIANNVKTRSASKKIAQKAKAEGNMDLYIAKNNEQNMMKIYNNSLSGSFAQKGCVLVNSTAHNTLTSITRSVSSLANANNEKILAGNRYYPTPLIMFNNIVYIVTNSDTKAIQLAVEKFNLHLPTTEETIEALRESTDLYFTDNNYYLDKIKPYLDSLLPSERAAICYVGDLFHIKQFNSVFIRTMLEELSERISNNDTSEDIPSKLYSISENILNFVHQIWFSDVKGFGKDYAKLHAAGRAANLLHTAYHVEEVLEKYKDFIKAFFVTDIIPNSSNKLKYMRRKTIVLSDTDSTCFTLDKWVEWYNGSIEINDKTIAIASAVGLISTETISHLLAKFSANMNVEKELLHTLAMKNEFLWTVHMPTEVSKHYIAYTVMQEGNVFAEPELEIKGVHLKNSALPATILKDTKSLIEEILSTVHNNKKISMTAIINRIKKVEEDIATSISKGESIYLKKSSIKNKEAYAENEFLSPYQRHTFWVDVFQDAYGTIPVPPYNTIKVPTTVTSRKKLSTWIDSIENKSVAEKLAKWLLDYNKKDLPTIYINKDYAQAYGLPVEILGIIDIKRIIMDLTIQYRLLIESLGIPLNKDLTITEQFA